VLLSTVAPSGRPDKPYDARPVSGLAGSHPRDAAGLPRGRGRLAPADVNEEQRIRIVRALISAAAEQGYHAVTVTEVVRLARVSREAYYRLFPTKLDCLAAALAHGAAVILPQLADAIEAV